MKCLVVLVLLGFTCLQNTLAYEYMADPKGKVPDLLPTLNITPTKRTSPLLVGYGHLRKQMAAPPQIPMPKLKELKVIRQPRWDLYDWQFGPNSPHDDIAEYVFNNGFPSELIDNFPFLSKLTNEGLSMSNQFLDNISKEGKVLTTLTGIQKAKFPVAIKKEVDGVGVLIGIQNIEYTNSIAIMKNVFVRLQYASYSLVFGAPEIRFSRTGGFKEAKLGLIGDIPIPINGDEKTLLVFQGYDQVTKDGCFVTIDCDGVKSGEFSASVYISDKVIYPVNDFGDRIPGYVNGKVGFNMTETNDFRGIVSFDKRFKINGIDKLSFRLSDAIFDGSELSNDGRVKLPVGYLSEQGIDGIEADSWQGLYVEKLSVIADYKDVDMKEEVGAEISGLIIDHFGITGAFTAQNLLSYDRGRIGNVNFSVDALSFGIEKSQLKELTCKGRVGIPTISSGDKGEAYVAYEATAQGRFWAFNAAIIEEVEFPFPLTRSKVTLKQGTTLKIGKEEMSDQTLVQVNLCGTADLAKVLPTNDSNEGEATNGILFQNFVVQSKSPVVREIGFWSIPDQLELPFGPFRITIEDVIAGKSQEDETMLHFVAGAAFSDDDAFNISARVGINLYGKYDGNSHVLQYDRTTVDRVELCVAAKSWGARVGLDWFEDDPIYGNGFKGIAAVGIESMGYEPADDCTLNAGIFASALFGNVDSTRFYNFELLYINLEKGLPMGPLALHGIGGAISNHMEVAGLDDFNFDKQGLQEDAEMMQLDQQKPPTSVKSNLGQSLLGLRYKPSPESGFSLRLMTIAASSGSSSILNMRAILAFRFNIHGGLDSISMDVKGKMFMEMTLSEKLDINVPAKFAAMVLYDNVNRIFSLNAQVDINVEDQIVGGGRITFYADEYDWYLHIGHPGEVGDIGLIIPAVGVKTNAYFCGGNSNVPDMPPLPKEIRNAFPGAGSSDRSFDVSNDLAGMAFGAHFALGTPAEKNFLFFYYKLHVLVGFDVNMRNYKSYLCSGVDNFGVRNWYAKGQVYSYIDGAIGLRSGGKKFPIMELKTAFKIYLETPMPTYGEFGVMVKYKVLGGLIKGRAKVEASFGEQCEFEKGNVDINVFADIIEPSNPNALGVTQDMTISGGVPFEQIFYDDDLGESLLKVALRDVKENDVSEFTSSSSTGYAYYKSDGKTVAIPCTKIYSEDHTFVTYSPEDLWPPNTDIWLHPKAEYSQSSNGGSSWKAVPDQDGSIAQDTVYHFSTASYPDHVPSGNILWTYPVNGMSNFYPSEMTERGVIQLHKGMSYLFEDGDLKAEVICHTDHSKSFEVPLLFESSTKRVLWDLPASKMVREGIYTIHFKSSNGMIAESIHFRCSYYRSLSDKLDQLSNRLGSIYIDPTNAVYREIDIEKFDELELYGNGVLPPLLKIDYNIKELLDAYGQIDTRLLEVEKNLYISTELNYLTSFQVRPRIMVKSPDQLGEIPFYEEVQLSSQYFHFGVHQKYIELRQAILDKIPPAEQKNPRPLEDRFRYPSNLHLTWRYGVSDQLKSMVRMSLKTSRYGMD